MQKQAGSVLTGLGRDPGRAIMVAAVGVAAAGAVAAVAAFGLWLLPSVAVTAVTLPVVLAYGALVALLVAGVIRGSQAAQAPRPAARAPRPAAPAFQDASDNQPNAFHQAYFFLRLQEELRDARRQGRELCVVAVDVVLPGHAGRRELAEDAAVDLARMAAAQSRTISQPLNVSDSEFVFSLGLTTPAEARAFMSKVVQSLGDYWCHFGIAAFPSDASRPEELVEHARDACEASRGGQQPLRTAA